MKNHLLVAALALGAYSSTAMAGQGFLRAEIGNSDVEISYDDYYYGNVKESDSSASLLLNGGYWFTPNFAIEGHAGSLYNADLGWDQELDLISIGVGIAAKKHLTGQDTGLFIGARAGIARLTAQVREDTFDVVDDASSTKPYYGVNIGYDFNNRWGLSLNYDRRKADFSDVDTTSDTITVGGEWRF